MMLRTSSEDSRRKPGKDMRGASNPTAVNGKELMHCLNGRLAGFIEKVHRLEQHNLLLEREIQEVRGKDRPRLEEEYGAELGRLRQMLLDITLQNHQIEIEHQNLEEDLSKLRRQHEHEARSRSDAERSIADVKKDISDAYQAKLQLDKKAQCLVDEIDFLKRNHKAEVSEMFDRIQSAQVAVRAHEFGHPSLTAALRDIRAQLEGQTQPGVQQQLGETFRSQLARLTEATESKREALKASQQEIQEFRRRMQAKNVELDCAKGTREALENQLHEVEDRHKQEIIHYQTTIKELENELINCKFDMSSYLREYQDLLNVKMALDVEILSYRKLLCGEEARLNTLSDTHISLPYIYHQSPIYALPCHSRPGGPRRRVEPHYKFVEEIITETTREIEMSEFEETGSEETEEEQGCIKREREGSKEERDDQDSGEDEGEQMSDAQQSQGSSVGCLVNKRNGGSPAEKDEETSQKSGEGSNETQISRTGDSGTNIQSKVQTELQNLKPGVPEEESKDSKHQHAEEDSFIPDQVKKPLDDTTSIQVKVDKSQEGRRADKVEDKS